MGLWESISSEWTILFILETSIWALLTRLMIFRSWDIIWIRWLNHSTVFFWGYLQILCCSIPAISRLLNYRHLIARHWTLSGYLRNLGPRELNITIRASLANSTHSSRLASVLAWPLIIPIPPDTVLALDVRFHFWMGLLLFLLLLFLSLHSLKFLSPVKCNEDLGIFLDFGF